MYDPQVIAALKLLTGAASLAAHHHERAGLANDDYPAGMPDCYAIGMDGRHVHAKDQDGNYHCHPMRTIVAVIDGGEPVAAKIRAANEAKAAALIAASAPAVEAAAEAHPG